MRRSVLAVVTAISLVVASAGMALAKGDSGSSGDNSTTWITGAFSPDCTDFDADAGKDISHVELFYADGTVTKDEHPATPFALDGDDPISKAIVKAGTSTKTFPCTPAGDTECSDTVDNADPEDTNAPLADDADPGCHTDGDPTDGDDTYDPADDDETDAGRFTCRASALRISDNAVLEALLGEAGSPFEPRTANAAGGPCATDSDSSLDETIGGAPGSIRITVQAVATEATGSTASANAGTSRIVISSPTGPVASVEVISTGVTASCTGAAPQLTSGAIVVSGTVGDQTFTSAPAGPITIPNVGVLHIDWQQQTTDGDTTTLVRRALFLEAGSPVGDVVIGESSAGYVGNPCD